MQFNHFLSAYYPDPAYGGDRLYADMLEQASRRKDPIQNMLLPTQLHRSAAEGARAGQGFGGGLQHMVQKQHDFLLNLVHQPWRRLHRAQGLRQPGGRRG